MKIYDGKFIVPGLAGFLVFVTFPIWINLARSPQSAVFNSKPNPQGLQCVESKEFMRDSHMQLLIQWRDAVVRDGVREYESKTYPGQKYDISLTNTCMKCHAKQDTGLYKAQATYCMDCHNYAGVTNYCWDCHLDPGVGVETVKESK